MSVPITNRQDLERRLRELTHSFIFRWGEPANRGDEQIIVALDRKFERHNHTGYIVSVFCTGVPMGLAEGLHWIVRPFGRNEIVAQGQTNHLGASQLEKLPKGDYTLKVGV